MQFSSGDWTHPPRRGLSVPLTLLRLSCSQTCMSLNARKQGDRRQTHGLNLFSLLLHCKFPRKMYVLC